MPSDAYAQTVFWSRQFSEHLQFLAMLFTDPAAKHGAEQLKPEYDAARVAALADRANAPALIQDAHDRVRVYQGEMLERLANGQFLGWAFPLFVDHVTREMDLYAHLVYGAPEPEGGINGEVKRLGAEHAQFAAHLLDPSENDLSRQASAAAYALYALVDNNSRVANEAAARAQRLLVTFLDRNEIGTPRGALSIIPLSLSEHVKREQWYFANTLEGES